MRWATARSRFASAQAAPEGPVRAELAISNPAGTETEVESLGFNSTPAMLAASTMTYTHATDAAAIATVSPATRRPDAQDCDFFGGPEDARSWSRSDRLRGAIAMSWSPRGRYLAIADGDGTAAALTIISPPR